MSIRAITWVMDEAPVDDARQLLILYALADHAHDDGTCAWPSQERIAERARCSTRTVRRHMQLLEEQGLIWRGDQQHVAHIRIDRRPIVWDLNLAKVRADKMTGRTSGVERADTGDQAGGHLGSNGRTQLCPTNHPKPPLNHPEPSSGASRIAEDFYPKNFDALAKKYPSLDLDSVLEEFKTYWLSNTTAKAKKKDWDRTFAVWCSRQKPKRMTREQKSEQMRKWKEEILAESQSEEKEEVPF